MEFRDPRLLLRVGIHAGTQECRRRLLSRQIHDYPEESGRENVILIATMLVQKPSRELINKLKNLKTLQENDPYINKLITEIPNNEGMQKRLQKIALNQLIAAKTSTISLTATKTSTIRLTAARQARSTACNEN